MQKLTNEMGAVTAQREGKEDARQAEDTAQAEASLMAEVGSG